MISAYDCIIAPVMSEKAMGAGKEGVYVFKVNSCATKLDIRNAVEKVFNVKVAKVNVLNRVGKNRTFRGVRGRTSSSRFAVVRLADGVINFEGGI